MAVIVDSMKASQPVGLVNVQGQARASTMGESDQNVDWELDVSWNWTTAKINLEIMQAAITALELAGFPVSADDNKILLGGSGGL
jgi:hypothetical protein